MVGPIEVSSKRYKLTNFLLVMINQYMFTENGRMLTYNLTWCDDGKCLSKKIPFYLPFVLSDLALLGHCFKPQTLIQVSLVYWANFNKDRMVKHVHRWYRISHRIADAVLTAWECDMKKYESAPDVNYTRQPSRKLFYAVLHNNVECALNYVSER